MAGAGWRKAVAGLQAFCGELEPCQGPNSGVKSGQFHPHAAPGLSTVQPVNDPVHLRPSCGPGLLARLPHALSLLVLCTVPLTAAAQGAATVPTVDSQMADRVRDLVAPAVPLPPSAAGNARVSVQVGTLDSRLRLAPCQRIEAQLPAQGPMWGRTRVALRCVEGERRWQVWLPVDVKVHAPALVAVRALPPGTVLTADMMKVAEVDWTAETQPPTARGADLVGRTTGRALQPGQAVRNTDLRQRQWFAAGDTVRLVAKGDGFVVGGEGQALGQGLEGQAVRVRTESGRVLTGMPVGEHQVELLL